MIKSKSLDEVKSFDKNQLISIPSVEWKGFNSEHKRYWNTLDYVLDFNDAGDALDTVLNHIGASEKAVLHDLSAVMVSTGLMPLDKVVSFWQKYFIYKEEIAEDGTKPLKRLIAEKLHDYEEKAKENNLMSPNMEVSKLDAEIEAWLQQKVILEKPRARELTETMLSLGYTIKSISKRGYWVKT
ncbi:hypothetical protein Lepto7376_3878 [[Leptolyngbya] sp. PCC 7376]|uniref:hypothetical protein n=1 Tax=[Leptolyngbya] sp. PCC 7376 TaxID=111781 RepID=UPI00029EE74B|nr:hypothetical protein [[Leptolyngbya] sp. PCC 7376]AFY40034.1 hypothetical protein Lepto7376_3878 [[Leptolyngbya] sp. PCC 7376]